MDAASKKPEKVNVTLASDNVYARSEIKDGSKYITSASLSPKGERMVVTARGEVFNIPVDKGLRKISPVLRGRTNVTLNGRRTENI